MCLPFICSYYFRRVFCLHFTFFIFFFLICIFNLNFNSDMESKINQTNYFIIYFNLMTFFEMKIRYFYQLNKLHILTFCYVFPNLLFSYFANLKFKLGLIFYVCIKNFILFKQKPQISFTLYWIKFRTCLVWFKKEKMFVSILCIYLLEQLMMICLPLRMFKYLHPGSFSKMSYR